MSKPLDFAKIKADYPIEQVAARLGLKLKQQGNQYRCACPSGEGDERSLVITPAKGVWYSFAAQKGGDVLSLVSFVQGIDAKAAAAWIVGETTVPEKTTSGDKPSEGFKPLDYLQHDHPAVQSLGIDAEDAAQLGIGFAPRGVMRGMVAVPVRRPNGTLSGYVGINDAKVPSRWH